MQISLSHYRTIFKQYCDGYSRFFKNPIIYMISFVFCSALILFTYLLFLLNISSLINNTWVFGSNELKYKLLTDYFMIKKKVPEESHGIKPLADNRRAVIVNTSILKLIQLCKS